MKYSSFRPKGTSDEEVLASFLDKAQSLIEARDEICQRHKSEIEEFRRKNFGIESNPKFEKAVAENILAASEPTEFSYEFHKFRKDILDRLDAENGPILEDVFVEIIVHTSIRPLARSVFDADTFLSLVYSRPLDQRELPVLDVSYFDSQEIDFTILKIYVAFAARYGRQPLLDLMKA